MPPEQPEVMFGELVSRYAEEFELQEKLAQQLGRAIVKTMRGTWVSAHRFKVEVTPDLEGRWYTVRISSMDAHFRSTTPQTYLVEEDTLAEHTTSVAAFHDWVRAVAGRLLVMFIPEPAPLLLDTPEDIDRRVEEHYMKLEHAEDELYSFGFRRHQVTLEAEERAAIASIRKALDARPEQ